MGVVNRFTQAQDPLVFNPISVEQFAMVPLAKAKAKASGIRAVSSLDIDYDVDQKDQARIKNSVDAVDAGKDKVINRIMSEGVTDNMITEFMGLKQTYKAVKNDVKLAETNKTRIDKWKAQVMQLHQNDPKYIQYIYDKEYENKWTGTFREDGTSNQFEAELGPRSFSIVDDAAQALKGIPMTMKDDIKGGGKFVMEPDPNNPDGPGYMTWVTTEGKKVYENNSNVLLRMNAYLREYRNTETQRGAYAGYRGIKDEYIENVFNDMAQSMFRSEVRGGGSKTQVLNKIEPPAESIVEPGLTIKTNIDHSTEAVGKGQELDYNPAVRAGIMGIKPVISTIGSAIEAILHPGEFMFSLFTTAPLEKRTELISEGLEKAGEAFSTDTKEVQRIQSVAGQVYIDKALKQLTYDRERTGNTYDYREGLSTKENTLMTKIEAFQIKINNKKFDNPQEAYADFYLETIMPYIDQEVKHKTQEFTYSTRKSLENKEMGFKNDNKGEAADNVKALTQKSTHKIFFMGNKTVIGNGSTAGENLIKGLRNFQPTKVGALKSGEYFTEEISVGGAHPGMYLNRNGKFVDDIAYGTMYALYEKTSDGTKTIGNYMVSPPEHVRKNPKYVRNQNTMRAMGNIGIEGVPVPMTWYRGGQAYRVDMIKSGMPTNAANTANNEYGVTGAGALTFILPETGDTFKFDQSDLDNLEVIR